MPPAVMEHDDGLLLNLDAVAPAPTRASHRDKKRRGRDSTNHRVLKRARPLPRQQENVPDGEADQAALRKARAMAAQPSATKSGLYISSLFSRDEANADKPTELPSIPRAAPTNAPSADASFEQLGLEYILAAHLRERMDIRDKPTEIQRLAIPPLLSAPPMPQRDVLIQAQTGSGKTLTYLLPIVQSLLPLSEESFIDRSVGTLAIILAPTRELARQIYQVLERLLTLSLASPDEQAEGVPRRRARWIVPGLLTGGSTKNHEKQRLRKGCPILVSTPGRLLDHLQNTASLDVGKCRWLVLDEADRILELGFEEQLTGIIKALDGRRRLALSTARSALVESGALSSDAPDDQVTDSLGMAWWAWRRRVVLCSATLDERVQAFSGTTLCDPMLVRVGMKTEASAAEPTFAAPAQLAQHAVIVPPKLRFVSLLALLRQSLPRVADAAHQGAARIMVFLTCTDTVDFHWHAMGGARLGDQEASKEAALETPLAQHSQLFPGVPIYRLHGSMSQKDRIASLRAFHTLTDGTEAPPATRGGILLCTSVAARGLDLPHVSCVIQMDVPTEDGVEEYVHRVGRTARVGRQGTSWLMLMPHERPWLDTLTRRMVVASRPAQVPLVGYDTVLFQGFGGAAREYESRATDVQMALERWVLASPSHATLARTAFLAHIRAYATHPAAEKDIFHVHQLHLGHLAKAFGLREAPQTVQRTAKKEHERQQKPKLAAAAATGTDAASESRRQRMLAHLPTESM